MWFEELMGFREDSYEMVQNNIQLNGKFLQSKINQKTYQFGEWEVATLAELSRKVSPEEKKGILKISEIVGTVQALHCDHKNKNALFQAASQFNMLEMVGPNITPEHGVGIYEFDKTQGPGCAISCGAGTIFRNYFASVRGRTGQTENNQIDGLELIGDFLGNENQKLWKMSNGYCLPSESGLIIIDELISQMSESEKNQLKSKLQVGIQWDSEVTISADKQIVSQIYCSALPIGYSTISPDKWEQFARLILEATYEATFYAAAINLERTGNNQLFLTLVGGGVFQNKVEWILDAIKKSVQKFRNCPLEVKVVSYQKSNLYVKQEIDKMNAGKSD